MVKKNNLDPLKQHLEEMTGRFTGFGPNARGILPEKYKKDRAPDLAGLADQIKARFTNAQRRKLKQAIPKPLDKTPKNVIIYGSGFLEPIINSIKYWGQYGKSWKHDSDRDKSELKRLRNLKQQRGGKFELADLRDGAMGPIGWIRMGIRKKRQREINKLKKELGEK